MPLTPGTQLGRYEILAPIGAGGMGEVYRARDSRLSRTVAIKISKAEFGERFTREARAVAALNHPNICTLFDVGPDYLVMELVEGPTLAETINGRPLSTKRALSIAKQLAEALDAAHAKGVIHRDLKPANVKLTADDNVKVLDFGLAKAVREGMPAEEQETETAATTKPGSVIGTAAYMAPEQARGEAVDKRADIWSFGVLLYEMTTGERLFRGKSATDVLAAVLTQEPPWQRVPAQFRPVVQRCLAKNPKERLRDIGDVRFEPEDAPVRRGIPWLWAAIPAAAFGLLAAYHWLPPAKPASQPLIRLDVDLGPNLVSSVGLGPTVVLSPDGTRLVYVARGPDGKSQLVTRMLDQEQPAPIAGTEDAISPFFSADGRSVGFFTTNKLKTISLANGGPEVLCDAPTERGASWGDDGHIYAVLNFNSGVMRIPSGGGAALPVTVLNKANREFTHRWPQVLPGSQAVLFTSPSGVGNFDDAKVEIQSLRTGRRKTLVNGGHFGRYASTGHLLYVRQGTLFAAPFDSQRQELTGPAVPVLDKVWRRVPSGAIALDLTRNGVLAYVKEKRVEDTLDWLDSTGHTQPLRTVAAPYNFAIRFSPDGKRLALASAASGSLDVWTYESERNTMTRLTFAPSVEAWPVWSPDGRHIAFFGAEGTASGIYWMRSDGTGEAERLTKSDNSQAPLSISPDGKHLAFYERNPQTGYDLWTLRLEDPASDHPKPGRIEPFLKTPYNESAPMIAPDGRWLAYQSDESGANEIYVRSFPGTGGKWQVSTGGGDSPVWSRMAPELFYRAREGMMVANYSAAADTFTAGKPRLWARKANLSQWFDLAPDGKRFAIVQEAPSDMRGSPQVTLVLNFFDELNRRTQR